MPPWLVVLLVVFAVLLLLRWFDPADRFRRRSSRLPGGGPRRAIQGLGPVAMREHLESQRCPCGGALRYYGQGPRIHYGRRLVALLGECRVCGESVTLYYEPRSADQRGASE